MKSLFHAFAAPALGAALLGSALPLFAQGTTSYFTSFESTEGHAPGAFDGYPAWSWEGGLFASVTTPGFDGDQRLEVHGTGRLDYVPAVAFGPGAVWLDLMVRPSLGGLADLPSLAPGRSALSGFVQVGSTGEVYVFDGDSTATGTGRWRASGVRLTRAADGAFIPLRLTYRVDYASRRWDLFVDDRLVWADLGFADGSVPAFGRFSIRADSSVSTGLDFFYVGEENPLFADSGDGIPSAWWAAHGLNAATAGGRHGDADADGLSNLAEYLLGLAPSDPDSNHDGLPDGIATVDANFRSVVVGAASLLATAEDGLAWRASFSPSEGYAAGPLNGQQSWRGLRAEVTSGAEARVGSTEGAAEIEQRFQPSTASALWITFRARLQAGPLPEIQAGRQPFAALFGFAGSRALTVRDGEAWVPHFVSENAADWNTYVLHLDYATGRWLLALNGRLVASDLAFNDATRQTLGAFRALQAGVDGEAWIDDIAITEREPAGLDFDQDGLDGRDEKSRGTDSFLSDTDGDQLPDGWEVAQSFDPLSAADAGQDADGDSLSNLVEYQLGTTPRVANDRVAGALVAQVWKNLASNEISALTNSSRFPLQPTGSFLLPAFTLPYNFDRDYGVRIRGYLLAPVDGDYLFWVSGDFQSQLWLSPTDSPFDRQRIAYVESGVGQGNYDTLPSQRSAVIKLRAGQAYYFEVLQKGGVSYDHLNVAWRAPNGAREVIPAARVASFSRRADDLDDDGLPDVWETQYGLSAAQGHALHGAYGDFDGDLLSNLEEYQVGTDPTSSDTDGDGVSDYEAVRLLGVDPTAGLFAGDPVTVVSTPGTGGIAVSGDWESVDGGMEARVLRGSVAYDVTLSSAGIFRLDLVIRDAYEANPLRHFDVEVKVDGRTVGRLDIQASGAETGLGQLYLPWLEAGAHRIELVWHNGRPQSFLRVESLALVNPSALDADADGVADWMESRLDQTFSVDAETVQTAISPFTLEGGSLYPQFLSATARYKRNGRAAERLFAAYGSTVTADAPRGQLLRQIAAESVASDTEEPDPTAVDLTVEAGLARRFFAHVPLDPEAPVRVRVREGAGVRTVTKKLVWKPLNLLALEPNAELQLRDFDRLLVSAQKLAGGQGNSAPVALTLIRPDESEELYTLKRQDVLELGFDQTGVYQFWVQPKNEPERLALSVEVFRIELDPAPITIANALREWSPSALPEAATVQADSTVLFDEKLPVQNPRRFALSAPAVGGSLIARLGGQDGPLVDALRIKPLVNYNAEVANWAVLQTFADGTELWKATIDMGGGPVPADLRIEMRVIVGGALFDDGTLTRVVTAADFDENGVYVYYMLLASEARGSVCHERKYFEGGEPLGFQD
jgi:hypothetical protein